MMQKLSSASYAVPWMSAQKRQAREQRVHTSARLLLRAVLLALSFFLLVALLSSRAWADSILLTGGSVEPVHLGKSLMTPNCTPNLSKWAELSKRADRFNETTFENNDWSRS